jgi:aminoglycoside phosphotransferase (APT) family kinase protein
MYREHTVLQHIAQAGFARGPASYLHDATLAWVSVPYSVQSFVEGTQPVSLTDRQLEELADVLVELHSLDVSDLLDRGFSCHQTWHAIASIEMSHLQDWMRRVLQASSCRSIGPILTQAWHLVDGIIQATSDLVKNGRARPVLTHGDLGSHNLGWNSGRLYLYDWESAAIGDPAYDLARVLRTSVRSERLRDVFLRTYMSAYRTVASNLLGEDFVQRIARYELIAALHMAVWALGQMELHMTGEQDIERDNLRNRAFFLDSLAAIDPALAQASKAAFQS